MAKLSHVCFVVTIACYLQISSSNIISDKISGAISKVVESVEDALNLCPVSRELCKKIDEIVKSGPNLKAEIAELKKTDFLAKYKEAQKNEGNNMTVTRFTNKYGYGLEILTVETEDGYLLPLYRIPGKGDPVLIVTGITWSAIDWFSPGQKNCLPCLLADRGYDVFILNHRGTTREAKLHTEYNIKREADQYWDFSFDELGRFDLPATIDYVIERSGKPKVKYIGFSQGTTSYYVMASERPEYLEKITLMVSLGPIAFVPNTKNPLLRLLGESPQSLEDIRKVIGPNMFDLKNPLVKYLDKQICGTDELADIVCTKFAFPLFGFDSAQFDAVQAPAIAAYYPSDFSAKQMIHYGQLVASGKFRKYDYGAKQNLAKYGSEQAPEYALEKVTTPVALFYSNSNDLTSVYADVLLLKEKLPNVVEDHLIAYPTWSHSDYVWAKDNKELLYDSVFEVLKKY